eukprot:5610666-Amphidinium_carterae.3
MRFPAVIRWLRMLQQFLRLQLRRKWSAKGVIAWKSRLPQEAMSVIIEPAAESRRQSNIACAIEQGYERG